MSPVGTNHRPRIAVVIATVHRPDDVVRAVESVLACSHPSFEVLVVDQSRTGARQPTSRGTRPMGGSVASPSRSPG